MPWVQLEIRRGDFLPVEQKRDRVLEALEAFAEAMGSGAGG
jgi:hypothetical protein